MADAFKCAYCNLNPAQGFHDVYPICSLCEREIGNAAIASDGERHCRKCGAQLDNSKVSCEKCKYVELELVADEQSTAQIPPASHNWSCICGYAENDASSARCANCNRSPFDEEVGLVRRIGNFLRRTPPTSTWTCPSCSFEYNQQDSCSKCGHSKSDSTEASREFWSCLNCKHNNAWECKYCYACGCGQSWCEYLQFLNIIVDLERMTWKCPMCSYTTSLHKYKCAGCKQTPEEMEKTKESMLSKAKSLFKKLF